MDEETRKRLEKELEEKAAKDIAYLLLTPEDLARQIKKEERKPKEIDIAEERLIINNLIRTKKFNAKIDRVVKVPVNYDKFIETLLLEGSLEVEDFDPSDLKSIVKTGTASIHLFFLYYGRPVLKGTVLFHMLNLGLRPANLHEAITFLLESKSLCPIGYTIVLGSELSLNNNTSNFLIFILCCFRYSFINLFITSSNVSSFVPNLLKIL